MNFTFRHIATLLTLTLFSFTFVACGDDDDEPKRTDDTENPSRPDDDDDINYSSLIIGTWGYLDDGYSEIMAFSPDKRFIFLSEEEYSGYDESEEEGTYSISGNKLRLRFDDGEAATATIVNIKKRDTLVLSVEGEKITADYLGAWDDYLFDDDDDY